MKRRTRGGQNKNSIKKPTKGEKPINSEDIKISGLLWSGGFFTPK